jgi:putative DNA-invertase from lambdoid prophage Rac
MARRRQIDVIVVWKLDRWGRSVSDVTATLNELEEIGVGFVSITEALDFTTAMGRAMAGLLSVFAEFERDLLRERVKWGLENARKKGIRIGRPGYSLTIRNKILKLHGEGLSQAEIERRTGVSRRSVGRVLENEERST